jgi:hypothetical protein
MRWLDEILRILGCEGDGKLYVYWCLLDKDIRNGLVLVENNSQIRAMIRASKIEKPLVRFIDPTIFLTQLREDVLISGPSLPLVIGSSKMPRVPTSSQPEASSSSSIVQVVDKVEDGDNELFFGSDSDDVCEFYDSDFNAEYGDDDLFFDNVDNSMNDRNEKEFSVEIEDEDALEDEVRNLSVDK